MKKILFISGIQIFPPMSGGQLRSANICQSLVKIGHQVEIYSFTGRRQDYLNLRKSYKEKKIENLHEYINLNPLWGIIQFIFYRFKLPPLWLTCLTKTYLPLILKQKLKDCDIIVLDFPYLYPIATRSSKPAFLNAHNAEYELYKSNNYLSSIVKKIEIKAIKDVEQVLFCNEDDQNKFIKYVSNITNKSLIVPNGTDQGHIRRNNITRSDLRKKINITNDQHVFLFTGSQYAPNQEACKFLRSWCKENKEEIQDLDIVFLIVGSADREILSEPYLKVIGIVDDVAPYFLASDFGINPVVMGSGSNVKMVEYLTATLPIISTSFGSRGLNLEDKKTYWNLKRDYMLCTLKEAIAHPLEQRYQMAQLALHNNISKVDMSMSIESLMLKW